ncbi:MAG: PAS domain S-box protein [Acidimicrobiales bacterium]
MSQFDRPGPAGPGDGFLVEMLGVVFSRVTLGVATASINGLIATANEAFCQLVGYDADQLLERGLGELVHPDDIGEYERLLGALVMGEIDHFSQDVRYLHPEGTWTPVQASVGLLRGGPEPVVVVMADDATDRGRAHGDLMYSEGRNRSLVENISDVILILGTDGQITYSSPSVERVFGWTVEDVTSRGMASFIHPEDFPRVNEVLAWSFESPGTSQALRCRLLSQDGSWRTCLITGTMLADDPFVDGFVAVIRDISAQAEVEESLALRDARFKALVQNISDVIVICDGDGNPTYLSPSAGSVFGWDLDTMERFPHGDFAHPEDTARLVQVSERLQADPSTPVNFRFRVTDNAGGWRLVDGAGVNLLHDPAVGGLAFTLRDATALEEAEGRRQFAERRFSSLVENLYDLVLIVRKDGVIQYASPSVFDTLGWRPDEIVGRDLLEAVHADDRDLALRRVAHIVASPSGLPTREVLRFRHADGTQRYIEAVAVNLMDDPDVAGVAFSCRDITEDRRDRDMSSAVAAVMSSITSGDDLETVLFNLTELVEGQLDRSVCAMVLSEDPQGPGRSRRSWSMAPGQGKIPNQLASACANRAIEANVLVVDDLPPSDPPSDLAVAAYGWSKFWALPVRTGDGSQDSREAVGAVVVVTANDGDPADYEVRFLDRMSGLAAVAMERALVQDELSYRASHDPLTGLVNRTVFAARVEAAQDRSKRQGTKVGVLFLDLDGFKAVNDAFGHGVGDLLLAEAGERITRCLRQSDTAARFGGDEFLVLCEQMRSPEDAMGLAKRLGEILSRSFDIGPDAIPVTVTVSIGVAVAVGPEDGADELIRRADQAVYRAKDAGRDRAEMYRESAVS